MSKLPLDEKPHAEALPTMSSASAGVMLNGRYIPPPQDKDGKIWVHISALIRKDAQYLYDLWRNVENAPRWQEQISEVIRTGQRTSHWVMRAGDKTIEWDSEILAD